MSISNEVVVDSTFKYIVKSKGVGSETNQKMIETPLGFGAEKLVDGNTDSTVSLIECYYLIESVGSTAGVLTISAFDDAVYDDQAVAAGTTVEKNKTLTGNGKYGLRPEQLKFGNDKQFKLTTDFNVKSYLLVTEFRRN